MIERDDETFVREALGSAGKRPDVPAEPIAEIIGATRAVWRQRVRARRIRRAMAWTLPIAATLIFGLVLLWPRAPRKTTTPPPLLVATMIRANGVPIAAGTRIAAGTWIDVPANGSATLSIGTRSSLRLHGDTRVQLVSAAVTRLEYGAAYLDCPPAATDVTVLTAAGAFAPAGTQFEVSAARGGETALRVREGVVTLKGHGLAAVARAGEQLVVLRDGGLRRGAILTYDASWQWAEGVAPMLEIDGKSLRAFLEWIAHEKGRTLAFSDERAAALSSTIVLHGSVATMTLDEALQTIAAGSGFTYRVEKGVLRIEGL
jgi:hypothetical protein